MSFKEVGVILGTQGPFRNIVQIKIGNAHSVEFDFLEWWQLHKLYPQDWVVIHTHAPTVGLMFSNKDRDFYKAIELALSPYHSLFVIYEPKCNGVIFKYKDSLYDGKYDVYNHSLIAMVLPHPKFEEVLCKGLKMCFHLDYLVSEL